MAAAVGIALAAAPGCTLFFDGFIEQCSTDADCDEKGGEFEGSVCHEGACRPSRANVAGDWSCVGRRPPAVATKPEIKVSLRFTDLVTGVPLAGVTVVPCPRFDPECQTRLGEPVVSDAEGRMKMTLSTAETAPGIVGFSGYLLATADGRESLLLSFYPPPLEDFEDLVPLAEAGQFAEAASDVGVTLDPQRGNAILVGGDCRGKPSPGVTFRLEGDDPEARIFYTVGSLPNASATTTDAIGNAFAMNLPTGFPVLSAVSDAAGEVARFSLITRAGYLSIVEIRPDH